MESRQKKQFFIAIVLTILIFIILKIQSGKSSTLVTYMLTGVGFGYALQRGLFGFAGTVRRIVLSGSAKLVGAVMLSLVVATALTTAAIYMADKTGVALSLWINPINMALLIGGFMFGLGMVLGGCCASGTLTDIGAGFIRALVVLLFFALGVYWGMTHRAAWQASIFWKGPVVNLLTTFGYIGGFLVTSALAFITYLIVKKNEAKRIANSSYSLLECEVIDQLEEREEERGKFPGPTYFHKLFVEQWTLQKSAIVIAIVFGIHLLVHQTGWGISTTYGYWIAWVFNSIGIDISPAAPFINPNVIAKGFWNHNGSMHNLGILFGALLALLSAGKFTLNFKMSLTDFIFYAIGGLLMGYGTRIALGCNVGAFYTPVAMHSLSGWVYMVVASLGGFLSMRLVKKFNITG